MNQHPKPVYAGPSVPRSEPVVGYERPVRRSANARVRPPWLAALIEAIRGGLGG